MRPCIPFIQTIPYIYTKCTQSSHRMPSLDVASLCLANAWQKAYRPRWANESILVLCSPVWLPSLQKRHCEKASMKCESNWKRLARRGYQMWLQTHAPDTQSIVCTSVFELNQQRMSPCHRRRWCCRPRAFVIFCSLAANVRAHTGHNGFAVSSC